MKFYYQFAHEHEVWGNYMCRLRFLDSLTKKIVYSRDVFYHNLKQDNSKLYIYKAEENLVILNEYKRPELSQIVLLDFYENLVYRRDITQELVRDLFLLKDSSKVSFIKKEFKSDSFILEDIKLPFFKSWK